MLLAKRLRKLIQCVNTRNEVKETATTTASHLCPVQMWTRQKNVHNMLSTLPDATENARTETGQYDASAR